MSPKATVICDKGDKTIEGDLPDDNKEKYLDTLKGSLHELNPLLVSELREHHLNTGIDIGSRRIFGHSDFTAFFIDGPAGNITVNHGLVIYEPLKRER